MADPRYRVLVAVEPRLLADSLVAVLELAGVDEVVTPDDAAPGAGHVDVALVSDAAADSMGAEEVIDLRGATVEALLALLDARCPTGAPRSASLRSHGGG